MKDNINVKLRVPRTYGSLPVLSWSTTCFGAQFRAGRQKFGTICLLAYICIYIFCSAVRLYAHAQFNFYIIFLCNRIHNIPLLSAVTEKRVSAPEAHKRIFFLIFRLTIRHKWVWYVSNFCIIEFIVTLYSLHQRQHPTRIYAVGLRLWEIQAIYPPDPLSL